jgi:hypothetical protein
MTRGGFSRGAKVVVEQVSESGWKVRSPFSYRGKFGTFHIRDGTDTDFASVPRVFVWFLPRYGRYTLAAIVHDYLWRHRAADGTMSYIDADGTFRRAMRELGVPFVQRWIMWTAVRWAALIKPRGRQRWWREAWRVLLITFFALPFLVPPAVLIAVSLFGFKLVEGFFFFPLKANEQLRIRARRRDPSIVVKQVNAPTLDWTS